MTRQGFPRALRLRRRREFLEVQRGGEKHHMRNFLVFVTRPRPRDVPDGAGGGGQAREVTGESASQPLPPPRLGVTVTRKVGVAVVRNRIKRLVREAFRRERTRFSSGLSMVWVAKRDAAAVSYSQVQSDMQTLARRLCRGPRR